MTATRGYTAPKQCPVGAGLGLGQCQRYVRPGRIMCREHWQLVPADLQRLVYSTLRTFNRTGSDADWDAYTEAREAALSLVGPVPGPGVRSDGAGPS